MEVVREIMKFHTRYFTHARDVREAENCETTNSSTYGVPHKTSETLKDKYEVPDWPDLKSQIL